jgi:hypothetical protein
MVSFPMGSGAAATQVGVPEHRAQNLIRWGKLSVPCVGNRRMWFPQHVLQLAKLTGRDTPEIRNLCHHATTVADVKEVAHAEQN